MDDTTQKGRGRLWVVLAIAAAGLVFVGEGLRSKTALGNLSQRSETDNIAVVPVQIGRDNFGIVMVDKAGKTLWVYEISSRAPAPNRLRLLAARNFEYDQLLQDYNTAEPRPGQVKEILQKYGIRPKTRNSPNKELEEILENAVRPQGL